MGIGIIALALWLIFGLDLRINEIMLFPPIVSYILLLIGFLIIYKKTMYKGFVISMILPVMNIMMCLLGNTGNIAIGIIEIILLYIMFDSIYKISLDYPKVNTYQRFYRLFLIVQLIMLIIALINEQVLLSIGTYKLIISEILLVIVIYHLIKINQFLEEDYEGLDFHILSYTKKHYIIMSLLVILSIGCIIALEEDYVKTVNKEMVHVTGKFFKLDKEDYKIPPFGYDSHKTTGLIINDKISYSGIKLFIKDDLLKNGESIKYSLLCNDNPILTVSGTYKIHEWVDQYDRFGYDPFEGYTYVEVENESVYSMSVLKRCDNDSLFTFQIELYDKSGDVCYKDNTLIENVDPITYEYEDNLIKINNLQYDMNGIVKLPEIEFKIENPDITHIMIYYKHKGSDKNPLLFMYLDEDDTNDFQLSSRNHLVADEVKEFKYLQIDYHNRETIVESRICELEVTP